MVEFLRFVADWSLAVIFLVSFLFIICCIISFLTWSNDGIVMFTNNFPFIIRFIMVLAFGIRFLGELE